MSEVPSSDLFSTHPPCFRGFSWHFSPHEREYAEDLIPIKVEIFPVFILPLEVLEKPWKIIDFKSAWKAFAKKNFCLNLSMDGISMHMRKLGTDFWNLQALLAFTGLLMLNTSWIICHILVWTVFEWKRVRLVSMYVQFLKTSQNQVWI